MQRIYAGTDVSMTFANVTTGGTYSAKVIDALGRYMDAAASESAGTATVTVAKSEWLDGASGTGKVQVIREGGGSKSIEASEAIRILPSLEANETHQAYRW